MCGRLRVFLVCCLLLLHAMIARITAGQQDSAGEYALKAAMLYNLTRFVEWPPSSYSEPLAPIVLCVLGRDPFGSYLTSTVLKKTVNGRSVLIVHPPDGKESRRCHVLYISSSERDTVAKILSILNGSSVLTVGEMTQFATRGGMIQFSLEDQQVRFDINLNVASQAGLKISAKLLAISRIVKS
jgi:YfiR/HmsC-like